MISWRKKNVLEVGKYCYEEKRTNLLAYKEEKLETSNGLWSWLRKSPKFKKLKGFWDELTKKGRSRKWEMKRRWNFIEDDVVMTKENRKWEICQVKWDYKKGRVIEV